MPPFLDRLWSRVRATVAPVPDISATLWLETLQRYPFLAALPLHDQAKLRALSALFLHRKQFHGAHGLVVTDAMAIDIAAQACLPLLHWGDAASALGWYDDFVGIVVHPGEAVARRQTMDEAGVVHEHTEVLLGEAMERGPIMLSWSAIQRRCSICAKTSIAGASRPSCARARRLTGSCSTCRRLKAFTMSSSSSHGNCVGLVRSGLPEAWIFSR